MPFSIEARALGVRQHLGENGERQEQERERGEGVEHSQPVERRRGSPFAVVVFVAAIEAAVRRRVEDSEEGEPAGVDLQEQEQAPAGSFRSS